VTFVLSQEQEELRRTVRSFLEKMSAESDVRRLMETGDGYDPAVWARMASELGLTGLAIPEEFGGAGYGPVELGIVLEEMGRVLLAAPFFSTVVLAANALLFAGDIAAQRRYLPGIAAGHTIGTLAVAEDAGSWDPDLVTSTATLSGGTWLIDGAKMFVTDGCLADLVMVVAVTDGDVSLFAVDGQAPGLTRIPMATMDLTRKQARLEFSGTPAQLIGRQGDGGRTVAHALDLAAVLLAAEQLGGAQRCLDSSVEYAKIRVQFGRAIGSFQAIKHLCADILLQVEAARTAVLYALGAAAGGTEELPLAASLAKSYCSTAYVDAAAANIQIHGGIGFTWEHSAHLYFRRATSSQQFLGSPAHHRARLAARIGLGLDLSPTRELMA
jgi:alkylation response protein AidB-like acyl-CoA dehydrogenase